MLYYTNTIRYVTLRYVKISLRPTKDDNQGNRVGLFYSENLYITKHIICKIHNSKIPKSD